MFNTKYYIISLNNQINLVILIADNISIYSQMLFYIKLKYKKCYQNILFYVY